MNSIQTTIATGKHEKVTLPPDVRKALHWPEEEVSVRIEATENGFTVERVKKELTKKDWDRIRANLKKISKSGKQNDNLTEFIRKERDTHF